MSPWERLWSLWPVVGLCQHHVWLTNNAKAVYVILQGSPVANTVVVRVVTG